MRFCGRSGKIIIIAKEIAAAAKRKKTHTDLYLWKIWKCFVGQYYESRQTRATYGYMAAGQSPYPALSVTHSAAEAEAA